MSKSRLLEVVLASECAFVFGVEALSHSWKEQILIGLLGAVVWYILEKILERCIWYRRLCLIENLQRLFTAAYLSAVEENRKTENTILKGIGDSIIEKIVQRLLNEENSLAFTLKLKELSADSQAYVFRVMEKILRTIPVRDMKISYEDTKMQIDIRAIV